MPEPLRLAVFDCDGTLVDSHRSIVAAMEAAFLAHGRVPPEAESVRRVVGLSLHEAVARLAPTENAVTCARLTDSYKQAFKARRLAGEVEEPLYPGTIEALDAIEAAGFLLGVATGKSLLGLSNTLERHGLDRRFVTLQTADRAPGKPAPDMLWRAMAETGARASETVMIGDTTFDMLMARNAGVRGVGVAWGYHDESELLDAGADGVVGCFADLPAAVGQIGERGRWVAS